jgi:PAS domain S-box-containing protein
MSVTEPFNSVDISFESIFHSTHTPYILLNADATLYTVAEVNQAFLTATKSTREALIGQPVFEIFKVNTEAPEPEMMDKIRLAFDTVIKTQQPTEIAAHRNDTIDPDTGQYREVYWLSKIVPLVNKEGIVTHVLHSPKDVTAQYKAMAEVKAANEALEEQRHQLYQVFMQAPVGIAIVLGEDYVVDLANPVICDLYGRTQDELMGKPIFSVMTESAGRGFEKLLADVLHTGIPFVGNEMEVPLMQNGEVRTAFVNFVYEAFRDSAGNVIGIVAVVFDVTEQVESKRQLAESEERFRFMAQSMPQQVWTATPGGALDYVNEVTEKYFGRKAAGIIGAGWQAFIHPDDLTNCLDTWVYSLRTGKLYEVEFRLRKRDGEYRWHLGRAVPFKSNERIISWLGTNTDIEDQKRNEQIKDEFISIASHELKTPLTSLKAYVQLLERSGQIPPEPQKFIQKSVHQIKRLENLVNDLLDVSKIMGGQLSYNMQPFDISELIAETVQTQQLSEGKHRFIVQSNPSVSLLGDYNRLEQVLTNFLSNAAKYSPAADKVIIRSEVQGRDVVVSVQDFGIGIEAENMNKLFDRFYRVDQTAMKFEGLGLGLYVASEILTHHQGNFWIDSVPGEGSTFYFKLPVL